MGQTPSAATDIVNGEVDRKCFGRCCAPAAAEDVKYPDGGFQQANPKEEEHEALLFPPVVLATVAAKSAGRLSPTAKPQRSTPKTPSTVPVMPANWTFEVDHSADSAAGTELCGRGPTACSSTHSLDMVLADLDQAEHIVYVKKFTSFGVRATGFVAMDCVPLRNFLIDCGGINNEDLDVELLHALSSQEESASFADGLNFKTFLGLLRESPAAETIAIGQFAGLSNDDETIGSEDCRSGLALFGQELGAPGAYATDKFNDGQWDQILDAIMAEANTVVKLEKWIAYCKMMARILRVAYCAATAGQIMP